ncbi:MAG: hypothetical protein ABIV21_03225, partial [Pyrinomonadaceae bacterium]
VALLVTAVMSTALKPQIFANSEIIGKLIIVALFIVGIIHLIRRIRDGFDRFTESDDNIHESILDDNERKVKPYSRLAAAFAILGGFLVCLGVGLLIGTQLHFAADALPSMFSTALSPEFIFYPPIVTLFVDLMHSFAMSLEG